MTNKKGSYKVKKERTRLWGGKWRGRGMSMHRHRRHARATVKGGLHWSVSVSSKGRARFALRFHPILTQIAKRLEGGRTSGERCPILDREGGKYSRNSLQLPGERERG